MSLQDDIFDVTARLEGEPELAAFTRLMSRLNALEREVEINNLMLAHIRNGVRALKELAK